MTYVPSDRLPKISLISVNEQDIPIDINTNKLLDWLISRRHVNKTWQNDILSVREKINNAIQDMPEHDGIVKLLTGQHINYFHCLKIVDILKETEADTKNLFGRYGSRRMQDWQNIVHSYQKDGVYLGEIAQMLIRNVNFEIPSLRKQISKCEQIQVESEKKIKECNRNEAMILNEFNALCTELGIPGKNVKKELVELLKVLPDIYERVAEKVKYLTKSIDLYEAYLKYHTGIDSGSLTILKYLITNGNTTTYEYTYGEKPIVIENSIIDFSEKNIDDVEANTIDFGDEIVVDTTEIDWGNLDNVVEPGFEIVEHADLQESGIVVETSGNDGGVAQGSDAFTVLDNPTLQHKVFNDLMALDSFLAMRLYELSNEDMNAVHPLQSAPQAADMQTIKDITGMLDHVRLVLNELNNKQTQHLHKIKHSPKYVDILTSKFNQKLALIDRMKSNKKLLENKIQESRLEAQKVSPLIDLMARNTRVLQKEIEEDICKKYKGRPVHIVGAVNNL